MSDKNVPDFGADSTFELGKRLEEIDAQRSKEPAEKSEKQPSSPFDPVELKKKVIYHCADEQGDNTSPELCHIATIFAPTPSTSQQHTKDMNR